MAKTKSWYSGAIGLECLKNQLRTRHKERSRDHEYYLGILSGIAMVEGMDAHVSILIHDFVKAFGYREAPLTTEQVNVILSGS